MPRFVLGRLLPREFHAFCIGTPKSGTTSMAHLFEDRFRAAHEAKRRQLVRTMQRHFHGELPDRGYIRFLHNRDRALWLDFEANCFLGYRPDLLVKAFPDAEYILTIREPRSWLRSILQNHLDYAPRKGSGMEQWHDVFFGPHMIEHDSAERPLESRGLYPLRTYLRYWVEHNQAALNALSDRVFLTVGTHQISHRTHDIAAFLGTDGGRLQGRESHANRTVTDGGVWSELDQAWVDDAIEDVCAPASSGWGVDVLGAMESTG